MAAKRVFRSATLKTRILALAVGTTLGSTGAMCAYGFLALKDSLRTAALEQLSSEAHLLGFRVNDVFKEVAADTSFLANTPDATDALGILTIEHQPTVSASYQARATRQRLERTFSSFLRARPFVTQVRLIERNARAKELVRVDRVANDPVVVPPARLTEKGGEPYMMSSAALWPGDWYWSRVMQIREEGQADPDAVPTARIVYAVAGNGGATSGFIVLNVDYGALVRDAVGARAAGTRLVIETESGDVITFSDATPDGEIVMASTHGRLDAVRPLGRSVSASITGSIGGGRILKLTLSYPEALLMAGVAGRLGEYAILSGVLVLLASIVAIVLGNRLAGHLSRLAHEVTRSRSDLEPTRIEGSGFEEVRVLARAFESVFNRLAERGRTLIWSATHDSLSGLLNRHGMDESIRIRLDPDEVVTVIHFDLDRFKLVNDTQGHQAGDAVITAIGQRLRLLCEPQDILCRMGGDEFVIIRKGFDAAALEAFAEEAIPTIAAPVEFGDGICRFGTSMGAAAGPCALLISGELIRRADHALYRAKHEGRGRFCFFGAEMERRLRDRALIASDLETALEQDAFAVEYMPKIGARDRRLAGFEALVRWEHPERGLLMPNEFLPIAEEMKLTEAIDAYVLRRVLDDRAEWEAQGRVVPPISVNVSVRRLRDPRLVESVAALDIPHGAVSFELLESVFLDDASDEITWSCDALREMGIGIEIDDFGSGHASILGITRIRPDWIKIDRALVSRIGDSESDTTMVRAILDMASAFGIRSVAEGVESDAQADILDGLGCDVLQGYRFGVPASREDVPDLLQERRSGQSPKSATS